jgi:hypothetical protein
MSRPMVRAKYGTRSVITGTLTDLDGAVVSVLVRP